jgi:hypothetical protein
MPILTVFSIYKSDASQTLNENFIIERPSINKWLVIKRNIYTKKTVAESCHVK